MPNKIIEKTMLSENVMKLVVSAPEIAKKRRAGQFIILRPESIDGERIPLTIADASAENGTVTLVVQVVGKSTAKLSTLNVGDEIPDMAGPLGKPTHIEKFGNVVCVGGGIGVAPMHPIAEAMKKAGNKVTSILGARNKSLIIMENEMRKISDDVILVTDDGSYGEKGFVTNALEKLIKSGEKIDMVVAIGPAIMMKMVSELTKPYNIPTLVSLNTVMIDGTGMCGGCRVTVGGETKFVCVDGPEFDGHKVDFDGMMKRQRMFIPEERKSFETFKGHKCKLENVK